MFYTGNRIFHEATPAEQFWLITDGHVFLDREVPGRDNFVLETLRAPTVLGCPWLFPPYRRNFGAVALSTTHALTFNDSLASALLQSDLGLGVELTTRFLQVMGSSLHGARRRLAG